MALEFVWNTAKAAANLRKHGVSFLEASTAFADPMSITVSDTDHSSHEPRYLLMGVSHRSRLLVVAHTEQGTSIRLISARKATRNERKTYEEES